MLIVNDPQFEELMKIGVGRVYHGLAQDLPRIAPNIQKWMRTLAGSDQPAEYFLHPVAFPLMLLPWWLERQINGSATKDFQSDLIFSNTSLYYYIRLVDNVMDGHATVEPKMLPAAGYFVNQFHSLYQKYFEPSHPFWEYFQRIWSEFCDVTSADGHLTDVDWSTFTNLVAHKVCAAKVSVAAVCFRFQRPEAIPLWDEWVDLFGCWHLFREDLFDWQQDVKLGAVTYILSEAGRQKQMDESVASWMRREGLDWGLEQLSIWMHDLRQKTFISTEVLSYLEFREKEVFERCKILRPALESMERLSQVISHG